MDVIMPILLIACKATPNFFPNFAAPQSKKDIKKSGQCPAEDCLIMRGLENYKHEDKLKELHFN